MDFSERLKNTIDKTGLTREEFYGRVGISKSQLFNYLAGRSEPTLSFFQRLKAEFPTIDLGWLMTGEGNEPEKNSSPIIDKLDRTVEALDEKAQKEVLKYAEEKKQNAEYKRMVTGVVNLEPKYVKQAGWISLNLLYLLAMPSMILLSLVAYKFIKGNTAIYLFSQSHYVYIPWIVHVCIFRRWWYVFLKSRCISFVNFCKYQGVK